MSNNFEEKMEGQAETVVGPSVKIQGDLNSEGNVKIEGQVNGKIKTSESVYVNQGAVVTADVHAGNAIIGGEIQGNLKISGNLILQSTAKLLGDISCAVLRVEDGAQFSGKCSMKIEVTDTKNGNGKKLSGKSDKPELEPEEE
ncbi:MAG: hypothetical protein COT92_00450 [Candidatus Doudnabacteria bacterium CG10_big_fil_rev_8_21_14_0_10_42_18]|uniref:Cell shape determination protein CcmA n=1 Tax=Candidatus Doudnabacteria bacterium CG10_big_fil_rev_8_21_14_0_10_42_18 TaxID=1974552 RepID=A0A2H0VBT7_9BACT|nr:MAG: hypothetical protein COT92_00450 [Candidatus Doudnabacteria bacterium CG10_big_fil_rev_8_21_14_0_10_42_18]